MIKRVTFIDSLCKYCFTPMKIKGKGLICPRCRKEYYLRLLRTEVVRWYAAHNVPKNEVPGETWFFPIEKTGAYDEKDED